MNLSRSNDSNVDRQIERQRAGMRETAAGELLAVEGGFIPPGVPVPYPNIGMASDTSNGTSSRAMMYGGMWL